MPQMAPISWLTLFILFLMPFIFMTLMNYFSFYPSPSIKKDTLSNVQHQPLNWKW